MREQINKPISPLKPGSQKMLLDGNDRSHIDVENKLPEGLGVNSDYEAPGSNDEEEEIQRVPDMNMSQDPTRIALAKDDADDENHQTDWYATIQESDLEEILYTGQRDIYNDSDSNWQMIVYTRAETERRYGYNFSDSSNHSQSAAQPPIGPSVQQSTYPPIDNLAIELPEPESILTTPSSESLSESIQAHETELEVSEVESCLGRMALDDQENKETEPPPDINPSDESTGYTNGYRTGFQQGFQDGFQANHTSSPIAAKFEELRVSYIEGVKQMSEINRQAVNNLCQRLKYQLQEIDQALLVLGLPTCVSDSAAYKNIIEISQNHEKFFNDNRLEIEQLIEEAHL